MRPTVDDKGYYLVNLRVAGKIKVRKVHQLVLETFISPKPCPEAVTRHLDGDPLNNRLGNLTWGTQKQNAMDRIPHGTHQTGEAASGAKLTWEKVGKIRASFTGKYGEQVRFAKKYGVSHPTINDLLRGRTW